MKSESNPLTDSRVPRNMTYRCKACASSSTADHRLHLRAAGALGPARRSSRSKRPQAISAANLRRADRGHSGLFLTSNRNKKSVVTISRPDAGASCSTTSCANSDVVDDNSAPACSGGSRSISRRCAPSIPPHPVPGLPDTAPRANTRITRARHQTSGDQRKWRSPASAAAAVRVGKPLRI